jgi:hypothetical protein
MSADTIARIKITLNDVEPAVLRRIDVPFDIRLDRLHLAIQAAMGWTNTHLYEIRARYVGWGIPDRDCGGGPLDARKARLASVLDDLGTKTFRYLSTSATAGSIRSRSSGLPIPNPALSIRA